MEYGKRYKIKRLDGICTFLHGVEGVLTPYYIEHSEHPKKLLLVFDKTAYRSDPPSPVDHGMTSLWVDESMVKEVVD